ncbi:MAG: ribosome biogenesis GTPase YlqF [Bacteriovoracaceae bacterium]|nr:ribosome biogenesis GTPase YlqF [Bacteriovoracaceae bacterium]
MKRENDPSAPSTALFNWYPGHMAKALREIKQKLKMVDLVLEIRDARAPLASGNMALDEVLDQKRKIIVLNKANLSDTAMMKKWSSWFDKEDIPYLFVNCLDKAALSKVISMSRKILKPKKEIKLMIVGLPNTGKSTIINQLANKKVTKVADKPGQTQIQQWIDVGEDITLLDTPGVMPPKISRAEHALWLSAIHAIPDDIASEQETAEFLVAHLLKIPSKEFLERYKLESADLSVNDTLLKIATVRGCLRGQGLPDLDRVYKIILSEFREGLIGKTCFGIPPK